MAESFLYRDKAWLQKEYEERGLSGHEIAKLLGCSATTILHWLARHHIPRRGPGRPVGKWAAPIEERFWSKVDKSGDCWEWQSCCFTTGYGAFGVNGEAHYAHRIAWELVNELIPEGLHCLHHCDNPSCVNPKHLFLGTQSDNNKDCVAKARNARGEKNGQAKLTETQVQDIRCLAAETDLTHQEIGDWYAISRRQVGSIVSREQWRHI